jgi:transcriptional regulator with XRE-family HTH domain
MITVNAVRKWMLGESMPTLDKLLVLADLLGVSSDWLRWGVVRGSLAQEEQPLYIKQLRPDSSFIQSLSQDVKLLSESHLKLVQALVSAMLVEQKEKEKVTVGYGE